MPYEELLVAGTFIAVGAAFLGVFLNNKRQSEQNRMYALNLVFEKLSEPKKREARQRVLYTYAKYLADNNMPMVYTVDNYKSQLYDYDLSDYCKKIKHDLRTIKTEFEQIAIMQKHGLINENAYFDAYWGSMLRCYPALYGHIRKTRRQTGIEHFTVYFEKQCDRALDYWRDNHSSSKIEYYVDEDVEQADWSGH